MSGYCRECYHFDRYRKRPNVEHPHYDKDWDYYCNDWCKYVSWNAWESCYSSGPKQSGSGSSGDNSDYSCFVTTALCYVLHMQDDCAIMEEFRYYRSLLRGEPAFKKILSEYKAISLIFSPRLMNDVDKTSVATYLLERYMKPASELLKQNKAESAYALYDGMKEYMCRRYCLSL